MQLRERPLLSNGYTLASRPDRLGWLVPSDPGLPIDVLREQYDAQGYVWLKHLIAPADVWDFSRPLLCCPSQRRHDCTRK